MKARLILVALLLAVTALFVGQQKVRAARLGRDLDAALRDQRTLLSLQAEHDRLSGWVPDEAEMTRRRAGAAEAARLRAYTGTRTQATEPPSPPAAAPAGPAYPLGQMIPATKWQDRGRTTPADTLETVLWASAGGELEALTKALRFDPASQARAETLLAQLPEATRRHYATPETLLASLVAKEAPLGALTVLAQRETGPGTALAYAVLQQNGRAPRQVCLTFRQAEDGWQLVVPPNAVEKIATAALAAPASP